MASYYPPVGFHFKVQFEGIPLKAGETKNDNDIRFQEVSGLNASIETETYQEGGENRFSHRLPKPATYQNLVLKRGMLMGSNLINWFNDAITGFKFKPARVIVTLLNEKHQPLETWSFENAYPVKWNIDAFNAQDSKIVAETIELSYQYFTRASASQELLSI